MLPVPVVPPVVEPVVAPPKVGFDVVVNDVEDEDVLKVVPLAEVVNVPPVAGAPPKLAVVPVNEVVLVDVVTKVDVSLVKVVADVGLVTVLLVRATVGSVTVGS